MRRIWTLAVKDVVETSRDRLALLFIVIMPLAFTGFFGLMFGSGSDRLPLALHDGDGGEAARQLVTMLEDSEVLQVRTMTALEAEEAADGGRVAAALLIPAGFSADLAAGQPPVLQVVAISGVSGAQAAQTEIGALAGQIAAAERAARVAVDAAGTPARTLDPARDAAGRSLADPVATVRTVVAGAAGGQIPSGFVLSSPGMIVNFILFSMLTAGIALIQERRNFTLLRLMTTRLRRSELVAGKAFSMFVLTFVQQIILISAGQFLFGVEYLRDPAALLVTMVSLSLVASTLGLLLASLLPSEQALVAATVIVSMAVAALSGAWFPREIAGETFQAAGSLLPTAWILDALRGIVVRGYGVSDVLPAAGIAAAWSAGLFALAVWRFRLSA
jgi:ABC-2 type transport system permease protein